MINVTKRKKVQIYFAKTGSKEQETADLIFG
jgi:hypothetical protein